VTVRWPRGAAPTRPTLHSVRLPVSRSDSRSVRRTCYGRCLACCGFGAALGRLLLSGDRRKDLTGLADAAPIVGCLATRRAAAGGCRGCGEAPGWRAQPGTGVFALFPDLCLIKASV
jgi:hypothetical protein